MFNLYAILLTRRLRKLFLHLKKSGIYFYLESLVLIFLLKIIAQKKAKKPEKDRKFFFLKKGKFLFLNEIKLISSNISLSLFFRMIKKRKHFNKFD